MSREPEAQMLVRTHNVSVSRWISDILRAIRDKSVLKTSSGYMVRDFLHPYDFYGLIGVLLASAGVNATDSKPHYYSLNTRAADFGYQPVLGSIDGLLNELDAALASLMDEIL